MTVIKSLAVITGLLVLATTVATSGIAHALTVIPFTANTSQVIAPNQGYRPDAGKTRTQLTMDSLPGCSIASPSSSKRHTCTGLMYVGDDVKFIGKLMTADGEGIPQKTVKIYVRPPFGVEFYQLTLAVTGTDGRYEAPWHVALLPTFMHTEEETIKKLQSQALSIVAIFEGDQHLAYSKTSLQTVSIKVKDLITTVKSDKTQYGEGEKAQVMNAGNVKPNSEMRRNCMSMQNSTMQKRTNQDSRRSTLNHIFFCF